DEAARTHAERMHAALLDLRRQPVARRRQQQRTLLPHRIMILPAVDERLRMLDAHAHREGLLLQPHARLVEQPVDVARRMPRRQNDLLRAKTAPVRRSYLSEAPTVDTR